MMKNFGSPLKIGVISDTHGFLRPEVFDVFSSVDHILHAGDVCSDDVLAELARLAPVSAVRGNSDFTPKCRKLPLFDVVKIGRAEIFLHHGHVDAFDGMPAGVNIIVSGHTHLPRVELFGGILRVNPGSAGPRRPSVPVSVAVITIYNRARSAEIIELPEPCEQP